MFGRSTADSLPTNETPSSPSRPSAESPPLYQPRRALRATRPATGLWYRQSRWGGGPGPGRSCPRHRRGRDVLTRSLDLAEKLGIPAVIDALDAGAKAFSERFGFLPLTGDAMR